LPSSRDSNFPSSSFWARIVLPIFSSSAARSWMLKAAQPGAAATAAAMASRACSAEARA